MIKNVIFDFGNVIGEWNEDKIAANYAENNEEKEILKKVIFKSDEWLKLDSGVLTYQEAIPTFKEKLPDNLKEKVEEIMSTWREKMANSPVRSSCLMDIWTQSPYRMKAPGSIILLEQRS